MRAQGLDEGIADWMEKGETARPTVALLQDIDFMAQSLGCFVGLLSALAEEETTKVPVRADRVGAEVFLGSLRQALLAPKDAKGAS